MINTFYKDFLENSSVMSLLINFVSPIAKLPVKLLTKILKCKWVWLIKTFSKEINKWYYFFHSLKVRCDPKAIDHC